jgi:molecular chaperone DnaJ
MGCRDCKGSGRAGTANCSECQGQGFTTNGTQDISINIPAGVDTGHTVRVGGYGEPSKTPNGKNGDLNVILIIKEHKIFKRYGSNLSYELPVGYGDLCVGSVVEVPTLTGAVLLTIPPNTQDLTQFRLKGMGLPYFHGGKGDLLVVAKLTLPNKDIVAANRDLFDKLALLEKDYLSKARERLKK